MFYILFNAFLYIVTFVIARKSHPGLCMGNVLLGLYTIVAIACVVTYSLDIQYFDLELWPLLYLYVAFLLSSFPLTLSHQKVEHFRIRRLSLTYFVVVIMIIASIINIYYSLTSSVELVAEEAIKEMYHEKGDVETSVSTLDWLSKNILSYGALPFYMIVFYYLTLNKKKFTFFAAFSISLVFFSLFLVSAMRVLRWNILHDALCAISGYLIFYQYIPHSKRKIINILLSILGGGVAVALVFIAFARFTVPGASYGGDPFASLIFYLGHSMMVFDYGITDTIRNYYDGKFMLGIPNNINLGTHNGGDFPTYIGNLYVDFGPFVTMAICGIVGVFFNFRKRIKCLADAFLISYYFVFICMGVFSHAFGYIVGWIYCIFMFWIMKIVFK